MADFRFLSRIADFPDRHRISVSGHGERTVVLGNGFGTEQKCWNAILPWLEARFRVVRFDWAVDPQHFEVARYRHMESYAEDLLAVIEYTRSAPCSFVGHSVAGAIAVIAARLEPSFFERMVMIAPAPRYISDDSFAAGFDADTARKLLDQMGKDYMGWVQTFAPLMIGAGNDAAIDEFSRSLRAMRPDVALSMASTIFHMDLRDSLDGFRCPTTIIQPTNDPAVPVSVGQYLLARLPQARMKIIEASGHFPHMTETAQVTAVLEEALAP